MQIKEKTIFTLGLYLSLLWGSTFVNAATPAVNTGHVRAKLVVNAPEGVAPGETIQFGLSMEHQANWHTYWKNPGDSGLATTFTWKLPPGFIASEIAWPVPQQLPIGPLMNFGYEGTLLLPVSVTIPRDFDRKPFDVQLHAEWLVCKETCIPESGDFSLHVPADGVLNSNAALFRTTSARQPKAIKEGLLTTKVEDAVMVMSIRGLPSTMQKEDVRFFPEINGVFDHAASIAQRWDGDLLRLRVPLSPQRSESPASVPVVLTSASESSGIALTFPVEGWPTPSNFPSADAAREGPVSFLTTLAFAFLGGLILNLMPCVFPVLALKVCGFVNTPGDRRKKAASGVAYTIGVVLSFVILAGLLMALRGAGQQLGWGFQLQSPFVVAGLAVLFSLIGLNLAGHFEIGSVLPSRIASMRSRHPLVDDALSGTLAVAIASPCTAPFMGAALGAALTLPPGSSLIVFASLGLGMASPYLAASLSPGIIKLFPRPGPWMTQFRTIMAFPMFATVVWLTWVLGQQIGIDGVAAILGVLVSLAFFTWTLGVKVRSKWARYAFILAGLTALVTVLTWAWPMLTEGSEHISPQNVKPEARWQPWSPEAVESAQKAGRPVFVDFTAAWCVTCQVNKRSTLADVHLLSQFEAHHVLLLRADWTRRDPIITQELARLGRNGVPVYAIYSPRSDRPRLLSEVLTVNQVQDALTKL